jgi:hypothetical protein
MAGPTVVEQRRYIAVHTGDQISKVRVTDVSLGGFDRSVSAANQTGGIVGAGMLRQVSTVEPTRITFNITGDASQAPGGNASRYVQVNSFIDVILRLDQTYRFEVSPWSGFSPTAAVGSPVQGISGQWSVSTARYQTRFDRGTEAGVLRASRTTEDSLVLSQPASSIPLTGSVGPGNIRFQAEVVGRAVADASGALLNFDLGSSLLLQPLNSVAPVTPGSGVNTGGGSEVIPLPPAALAALAPMIGAMYLSKKRKRRA